MKPELIAALKYAAACQHLTASNLAGAYEIQTAAMADEMDRLRATISRLESEKANLKALLKDICDEWNEGCDPTCDSMAHTETCKAQNIAEAKRAMRETISRLREYVGHKPGCCWWTGTIYQPHPCDCGYDELIKEIGG